MTDDAFAWTCHTCDESGVEGDFERAHERFSDHAARGCEVVLRNVSSKREPPQEPANGELSSDDSSAVD